MSKSRNEIIQCITNHTEIVVEVINLQDLNDKELGKICATHCQGYSKCFDNKNKI
ncbi:hypothetical protein KAS08_00245 [Candidatus Pacearchaeota archaeon]|nr:hypothetical protein [Candidatus Pacearchaeota archaeon]